MTTLATTDPLPSLADLVVQHDSASSYAAMHRAHEEVASRRGDDAAAEKHLDLAEDADDAAARTRALIKHKLDCAFGVGTGDAIERIFSGV